MTPRPPLAWLALLSASGAMLAGCASAPTRFFTLDSLAPAGAPAASYAGPAVKVMAVNIPPALDREELVSETGPGEVRVHDFEHWEAPLGLTARQILIQDLAGRLPAGAVLGPASPGGQGVASLSLDIVSFRAGPDGAQMQASWTASLPGAAGPSVYRAPLVTLQGPGTPADGAGIAQAFSALLAQVSDQVAAGLPVQMLAMEQMQARAAAQATSSTRVQTTTRTVRSRSSSQP